MHGRDLRDKRLDGLRHVSVATLSFIAVAIFATIVLLQVVLYQAIWTCSHIARVFICLMTTDKALTCYHYCCQLYYLFVLPYVCILIANCVFLVSYVL